MRYLENILGTIGNTPLIKINALARDIPALVLAKVETFNPGHSIKDRMALKMLEVAEAQGKIKPGGTIIECTSGNTGMGLAIAASVKGYHCIFTTSDKQSKEKIDLLRAVGAEVIVCPTNVEADDPRSYYSVAEKLSNEIPNSFWFNQYDNLANRLAHYETTGPEIWEQTDGKVTHLVVGVGTGGTISGTAKYLKEQNPDIQIWGIDTYGSALKKYHETREIDPKEIYPYITEGIGEDIIPANVDFDLIDHFEKVDDKSGALMARQLARKEGLLLGYSCGSAMAGLLQLKDRLSKEDVVVIIFHDHGSRYVGKVYNDDWMRDRGFLDDEMTLKDIVSRKKDKHIISIKDSDGLDRALEIMKGEEISQMPVLRGENIVGSVTESGLLRYLLDHPGKNGSAIVRDVMEDPLPVLPEDMPFSRLKSYLNGNHQAFLVKDKSGNQFIVTQYDLLKAV